MLQVNFKKNRKSSSFITIIISLNQYYGKNQYLNRDKQNRTFTAKGKKAPTIKISFFSFHWTIEMTEYGFRRQEDLSQRGKVTCTNSTQLVHCWLTRDGWLTWMKTMNTTI